MRKNEPSRTRNRNRNRRPGRIVSTSPTALLRIQDSTLKIHELGDNSTQRSKNRKECRPSQRTRSDRRKYDRGGLFSNIIVKAVRRIQSNRRHNSDKVRGGENLDESDRAARPEGSEPRKDSPKPVTKIQWSRRRTRYRGGSDNHEQCA